MSGFTENRLKGLLPSFGFLLLFLLSLFLLFPFYLALASVAAISIPVNYIKRYSRLSTRALRLILLGVTLLLLFLAAGLLFRAIVRESEGFFTSLYDTVTMAARSLYAFAERLKEALHIADLVTEDRLAEIASSLFTSAMSALSSRLTAFAAAIVKALPQSILATVLYLLSLFYIALDYEGVRAVLRKLTPKPLHAPLAKAKRGAYSLLRHTARAYGILFLITFSLVALAFCIMGIDYPLWWAFLAAGLDTLPAIGIGIVLIPWGVGLLLVGRTALGVAMLILYAALTLLRQVLEPRILGRELGVPSLVSLLSLYIGFQLFGGWGILLSPILSVLFTRLFHRITSPKGEKGRLS